MDKKYNMAIRQLDHAAESANIYKELLGITDDSDIRCLEQTSDKAAKASLRIYLIGDIRQMGNSVTGYALTTPCVSKKTPDAFKDFLASNAILFIESLIHEELDEPEEEHTPNRLEQLAGAIPEKNRNLEEKSRIRAMVYQPFADPLCNSFYSWIDWDTVFTSDSPFQWCRNLLDLLRNLVGEEIKDTLEPKREELIHTMVQYWKDRYPVYQHMSDQKLRSMGLEPYGSTPKPKPAPVSVPLVLANPEDAIRRMFSESKESPRPIGVLPDETETVPAPLWMTPFTVTSEFLSYTHLHEAKEFLCANADTPLLFYTALDLYSRAGKANLLPILAEILLLSFVLPKAADDATRKILAPEESDAPAVFDTQKPMVLSKDAKKEQKEILKALQEEKPKQYSSGQPLAPHVTLYQIIAAAAHHQPDYEIRMPTEYRDLLIKLGYGESDASLLTGYIAGLKEMDAQNILLGRLLDQELKFNEDQEEDDPPDESETLTIQIQDILKEHQDRVEGQANDRIDRIQAKALKESGQLQHDLNQARQEIEALTEEKETYSILVRDLERECERLRDLSREDPDDDPEIYGDDVPCYPSEIGSSHKILVIGGSDNWVKELSKRFPYIRFFGTAITPDDRAIFAADLIFMNIFVLKHKHYWPVAGAAKRAGKTMHQFPSSGINACSDFIVQTFRKQITEKTPNTGGESNG